MDLPGPRPDHQRIKRRCLLVRRHRDLGEPRQRAADLEARLGERAVGQGAGQGLHAVADPFIEIDPRFADRDQFRVIVSEGVVNRAPEGGPPIGVPGPCAALMLTSGLVPYAVVLLSRRIRGRRSPEVG